MLVVVAVVIALAAGVVGTLVALRLLAGTRLDAARRERHLLLAEAKRDAEATRREAAIETREQAIKLRGELEAELRERRDEVVKIEERVLAKEDDIDRKLTELMRREQGVADREVHLRQLQEDMKELKDAHKRELEHLTGVDFIIDDTPNAVVLSSFDGIRREIARMTLLKLIEDGRIHPTRIEEMYYLSKAELDEHIRQAGEQAVFEANCGELHEELVKILGRLRYRTSYGQNVLKHTLEVVQLAGIMAAEVQASVKTAKRAALLHDLGKAMTHEVEGSHAHISTQLARRYGESPAVCHAIEAHHYEVQPQTVEAVLVIAADAISASRPGARGESLEQYLKRLESLEELAGRHPGVEKVYALQAGREIRVLVKPHEIDDDGAVLLSHEIAREIEEHLEYPGQIKVTVIRESRAVDVASNKQEQRRGPTTPVERVDAA